MRGSRYNRYTFLAFFSGLVATLFIPTPFGIVSMLDFACYFIAPFMLISAYEKFPKSFKGLLVLSILWVLNGILSDLWRGTPFMVGFKAWMILVDSVCMLIVGGWFMTKSPRTLIWFLVGVAISNVISLYKFQNGALLSYAVNSGFSGKGSMTSYLIDKQVVPLWTGMITFSGMFFLRRFFKIPRIFCLAAYAIGAFYMMINGGSRSGFLISISIAMLATAYYYFPKIYEGIFKRKITVLFVIVLAALAFNSVYLYACGQGWLGESGYAKFERKKSGNDSFMDNRNDFLGNWPFLWRSPLVGAGSEFIDRWGYLDNNPNLPHEDEYGRHIDYDVFFGHSCIVGAWTSNGLFGLIFWGYVLVSIFNFLGKKVYYTGDVGMYVLGAMIGMLWSIAFSPYGMFRAKAMFVAAFVAFARDERFLRWIRDAGLPPKERAEFMKLAKQGE